jgi:hypothetical protein
MAAKQAPRLRRPARSLVESLRQFLTPAVWKQAHQAWGRPRRGRRWDLQPLVLVLALSAWCCGDSQAERFEAAKAVCVRCRPKHKRPGQTIQGFHQALARLPMPVLRAIAAGVRGALAALLDLGVDGFIPLGCDGTRLTCPRAAQLERFLSGANPDGAAPSLWLTAVVHLRTGVPWCWRWGKGDANERRHLQQLVPLLPALTLLVADAGYLGYDLLAQLNRRVAFLIRGCSKAPLYTAHRVPLEAFREGECLYWPQEAQRHGEPPVRVRALCLRKRQGPARGQAVWLITNVLDPKRLSGEQAGRFYRWRWENEGLFRTYKRTLRKMKLKSRTVALLHREAEGSLLALQLLLAQGALALPRRGGQPRPPASPRQVLLEVRREIGAAGPRRRRRLGARLRQAQRERRRRTSAKQRRPWPGRAPHRAPKPPRFLKLTKELKAVLDGINYAYG